MSRQEPLPAWLRELRLRADLTQADVAAAAGVGLRNVQRYESGTSDPRGPELLRLLSALSVAVEPRPPGDLYQSVNGEVHALREALAVAADELEAGHRHTHGLLAKLAATVAANSQSLLILAQRLEKLEQQRVDERPARQRRSA